MVDRRRLPGTGAVATMVDMPHPPPLEAVTLEQLAERAAALTHRGTSSGRALVGIVGPPGAGKSTIAQGLVEALRHNGVRAALVAMDGFHLAQAELERLGIADRKGAPDTFDAAGYVALLRRLRSPAAGTVWAPQFCREIEEAVAAAVAVPADVGVVVTEGNYLLLADGGWSPVRGLLDEAWFVAIDPQVRRERLANRHRRYGRSEAQAWKRTLGSDEVNAGLVDATRERADLVVTGRTSAGAG